MRRGMGTSGSPLPYDAEIEYLQSSGTQYIRTAFKDDSNNYFYSCEVAPMQNTIMNFFGVRLSGTTDDSKNLLLFQAFASSNQYRFLTIGYNYELPDTLGISQVGVKRTFSYLPLSQARTPSNLYIPLFGADIVGSMYLYSSRIYWWRVNDAKGNILAEYIPVRVGSAGYMYDKVSGQLFGNAGTGAFILGPDK